MRKIFRECNHESSFTEQEIENARKYWDSHTVEQFTLNFSYLELNPFAMEKIMLK
jgi:hypothetical protein